MWGFSQTIHGYYKQERKSMPPDKFTVSKSTSTFWNMSINKVKVKVKFFSNKITIMPDKLSKSNSSEIFM